MSPATLIIGLAILVLVLLALRRLRKRGMCDCGACDTFVAAGPTRNPASGVCAACPACRKERPVIAGSICTPALPTEKTQGKVKND